MSSPTASSLRPAPGKPLPLGACFVTGACRFSVVSRHATRVWLQLFDSVEADRPTAEFELDPRVNRTGDIWHIEVQGAPEGIGYLWRADGPWDPAGGQRFQPGLPLLDPHAHALAGRYNWKARHHLDSGHREEPTSELYSLKCLALGNCYDWQGDRHPGTPLEDSVIYELHARAFTRHPSSGVAHPGTFLGLTEKIDYLRDLGVTAVELLPVHEFNEDEITWNDPLSGRRLKNLWGYSTVGFFAPKAGYAASDSASGGQVREFRDMVKAFHRAGIEVYLDVVFNHTAEGDQTGPTFCFRGLDNRIYYLTEEGDPSRYTNYSGCGNTVNCNHPVVRDFIRTCLRYWVVEMHVDGFRFDLASILGRDRSGRILVNPPLVEAIAEDSVLRQAKIIAEAWDAGGAYQVGSFHGGRWSEWNGKYRDEVKRYWRGERFGRNLLATRITGSSDLYQSSGRRPCNSINYLTAHDGFTMNDLVSYLRKHNEANGEDNRDGDSILLNMNFGVEGPSADPLVERLRLRQIKSYFATLLLSQGVPMLLAGDELRRTQGGNNNAYCQDNEIGWLDWGRLEPHRDLHRFVRELIHFRRAHAAFRRRDFLTGRDLNQDGLPDIRWYEADGGALDWRKNRPCLACLLSGAGEKIGAEADDHDFYLMFNAGRRSRRFRLPRLTDGHRWRRVLDTAVEGPEGIHGPGSSRPELEDQQGYQVSGHAVVLLCAC